MNYESADVPLPEEGAMMNTLRLSVHLTGGQTMQTELESPEEALEYATSLSDLLNKSGRRFLAIEEIAFHTNAVSGFVVEEIAARGAA